MKDALLLLLPVLSTIIMRSSGLFMLLVSLLSLSENIHALAAGPRLPERRMAIQDEQPNRRRSWIARQIRKRKRRQNANEAGGGEEPITTADANSDTDLSVEQQVGLVELPEGVGASQEEREGLAVMKVLVEPVLQRISETNRNRYPDVYGEFRLLRFLRKEDHDPELAAQRFCEFLQWRIDRHIDRDIRAQVEVRPFAETDTTVADHLPIDFDLPLAAAEGSDDGLVAGYPRSKDFPKDASIVLHVGEWRTRALARLIGQQELSMETFLNHWIYQNESLNRKLYLESFSRKRFLYVDQICDLTKCHIGQLSPGFVSKVLKPWLSTTQRWYPDTTCQIRFVNPPSIIAYAWRVVAPLVDRNTVGKVIMCGGIKRQEMSSTNKNDDKIS